MTCLKQRLPVSTRPGEAYPDAIEHPLFDRTRKRAGELDGGPAPNDHVVRDHLRLREVVLGGVVEHHCALRLLGPVGGDRIAANQPGVRVDVPLLGWVEFDTLGHERVQGR